MKFGEITLISKFQVVGGERIYGTTQSSNGGSHPIVNFINILRTNFRTQVVSAAFL